MLLDGAHWLLLLLDEDGLASFPKTTGNRGIHVHVPLGPGWDSYDVRLGAVAVARELERRRPELITAAWWKEERGSRSEEHTSELKSLMRISYAVFCLKKKHTLFSSRKRKSIYHHTNNITSTIIYKPSYR